MSQSAGSPSTPPPGGGNFHLNKSAGCCDADNPSPSPSASDVSTFTTKHTTRRARQSVLLAFFKAISVDMQLIWAQPVTGWNHSEILLRRQRGRTRLVTKQPLKDARYTDRHCIMNYNVNTVYLIPFFVCVHSPCVYVCVSAAWTLQCQIAFKNDLRLPVII